MAHTPQLNWRPFVLEQSSCCIKLPSLWGNVDWAPFYYSYENAKWTLLFDCEMDNLTVGSMSDFSIGALRNYMKVLLICLGFLHHWQLAMMRKLVHCISLLPSQLMTHSNTRAQTHTLQFGRETHSMFDGNVFIFQFPVVPWRRPFISIILTLLAVSLRAQLYGFPWYYCYYCCSSILRLNNSHPQLFLVRKSVGGDWK